MDNDDDKNVEGHISGLMYELSSLVRVKLYEIKRQNRFNSRLLMIIGMGVLFLIVLEFR